jgi:hypothetical protein
LLVGLFAFAPAVRGQETHIVVGAWNVAAGRGDGGDGTPIPAARIDRIGAVIASHLKPDVLVLSEVFPPSAAAAIARAPSSNG